MMRRGTFFTFVSAAYDNNAQLSGTLYRWDVTTPAAPMTTPVDAIVSGGYSILEMAGGRDWFSNVSFTLALRNDYTVWAWAEGSTSYYPYTTSPIQISFSAAASIMHIAADTEACFAIDSAGKLWSWGNYWVMGVGGFAANSYLTPKLVSATGSFVSVNTRVSSAMALRSDGLLLAWGDNAERQLGHAGAGNTPDLVVGGITFVKFRVGGGTVPSVGIGNINGTLYTWGRNLESQCGIPPATATVSSPIAIATSFVDVLNVSARAAAIHALTGDVWTWGAGFASYAPAWHATTTHVMTNRSFGTSLKSFVRSTTLPYALDGSNNIWGWYGVPVGTGTQATSVPTRVSAAATFQDALIIGSFGQGLG